MRKASRRDGQRASSAALVATGTGPGGGPAVEPQRTVSQARGRSIVAPSTRRPSRVTYRHLPWSVICRIMLFLREGDALGMGVLDKKTNSVVQSTTFWAKTVERLDVETAQLRVHQADIGEKVAAVVAAIDLWPSEKELARALRRPANPPPLEYLLSAVGAILMGLWKTERVRNKAAKKAAEKAAREEAERVEEERLSKLTDAERVREMLARGQVGGLGVGTATKAKQVAQHQAGIRTTTSGAVATTDDREASSDDESPTEMPHGQNDHALERPQPLLQRAATEKTVENLLKQVRIGAPGVGGVGASQSSDTSSPTTPPSHRLGVQQAWGTPNKSPAGARLPTAAPQGPVGTRSAVNSTQDVVSSPERATEDAATAEADVGASKEPEKKLQAPQGKVRRALFKHFGRDGLRNADYADVAPEYLQLASKVVGRGEQHLRKAKPHEKAEWAPIFEPFEGMAKYVRALVALYECGRRISHLEVGSLTVEGVENAIQLRERKKILAITMVRNEL